MQRWTIRNVELDAVRQIQELCSRTGVNLGEAVSLSVKLGIREADRILRSRKAADPLLEAFRAWMKAPGRTN